MPSHHEFYKYSVWLNFLLSLSQLQLEFLMKPATKKKRAGSKRKKPSKKRFIEVTLVEGKDRNLFTRKVHWFVPVSSLILYRTAKHLPVMDPNGQCDAFARFFVRKETDPRVPEMHAAKSTTKYKVRAGPLGNCECWHMP